MIDMKKIRKNWRITPQLLDRMRPLLKPHETETNFVEDALHEKIIGAEELARKEWK